MSLSFSSSVNLMSFFLSSSSLSLLLPFFFLVARFFQAGALALALLPLFSASTVPPFPLMPG